MPYSTKVMASAGKLARASRLMMLASVCAVLLSAASAVAQQVVYDRYVKIKLPSDWIEKRSWELGDDRSLPLYRRGTEAVAFVWGFDHPLYRPSYLEKLASGDRLKNRLEIDLSEWPAEVSRYYAAVSSGFSIRASGARAVTIGPSFKPAKIRYLGVVRAGKTRVELLEYLSDEPVDQAFAEKHKLAPTVVGSRAQILFGQAIFGRDSGYTITACRFTTQPDLEWITPLLESMEAVPAAERKRAAESERARDIIAHAAALVRDGRYDQGLTQLKSLLAANPHNDNTLIVQGEALLQQGKHAEAEKMFRDAIAANPENDRAHFDMAAVLSAVKKRREAISELEAVQRLSPLFPKIDELLKEKKSERPLSAADSK